jgi:hypothetical protein
MKYLLTIAIILLILVFQPALSQEGYGFRVERITVSSDYSSIDVSGDAVIAVGKSGLLTVWSPRRVDHTTIATSDLYSISCMESLCVAVGKGGIVSDVDIGRMAYKSYTLSKKDLVSVAFDGRIAVIAASDELYIYRPGGEVMKAVQSRLKISRITFSEGVFIAAAEKTASKVSSSGDIEKIADYASNLITAFRHRGSVWALAADGLYMDGSRILTGSYTAAAPHPRGILLLSGMNIQLYDAIDRQVKHVATVTRQVGSIKLYGGDRVVASGPAGTLLMVSEGVQNMLTAPSGEYSTAVDDGVGGVYVAMKSGLILRYSGGVFTTYVLGDEPRRMTVSGGLVAILGSRSLWSLNPATGELARVEAPVKPSDFNDIAPSVRTGYWITLAGPNGIVDLTLDGQVLPASVGGKLLAVTLGYAVGEKIAAILTGEIKTSKQDDKLVDVDVTSCGAVAVSDKGRIAYLKPDSIDSTTVPNIAFTTISINPRGAYALAGGSKGELVIYDGYKATALPTALPEAVNAIAWADGKTALAVTPKAVYRIVEASIPEPRLEVTAPKSLEVFTGSSRRIQVDVKPLYGMSGEAELQLSTTNPQILLQQTSLKLKLSPMCTTKTEIGLSIPSETPEGTGSITISHKGVNLATVSLAVKKPGQQQQQQNPPPQTILQNIQPIAGIAIIATISLMIFRRLKKAGDQVNRA